MLYFIRYAILLKVQSISRTRYRIAEKVKLPMRIKNFKEIRIGGFYYIDKTGLIKTLLRNHGKVNLFTRPRWFGKTLNMSILRYFFETGSDVMTLNNDTLFDRLEISEAKDLCREYMGKFPVISISLKEAAGENFETSKSICDLSLGMRRSDSHFWRKVTGLPKQNAGSIKN